MHKLIGIALLATAINVSAAEVDKLVDGVMRTYGGAAAWKKVVALRQSGTVSSAMRGKGAQVRTWQRPNRLRVEITYPSEKEIRIVDGTKGWRNGAEVSGMMRESMTLQADRLALPWLLEEKRSEIKDLGVREGLRVVEVPLPSGSTLTVSIDPKTFHIVRSRGASSVGEMEIEFETSYRDFRKVGGLLFAFGEENFAQGMHTADTMLEKIEINPTVSDIDFRPSIVADVRAGGSVGVGGRK